MRNLLFPAARRGFLWTAAAGLSEGDRDASGRVCLRSKLLPRGGKADPGRDPGTGETTTQDDVVHRSDQR